MLENTNKYEKLKHSPPKPIEDYSKDSIKRMAVLFTDIVGSSKYFKAHGDIAGRKMLKLHQDIASPIITDFGGDIVKMLGDSVMAYFLNPDEAIKSAIKIQQKFQTFNNNKDEKDQIHIRLCVHYGEGIIDDGDIFGDVVNMAAKFLPLASGDEILISQELHENIEKIPHISFNHLKIPQSNKVLNGMKLLKVKWDNMFEFDPTMKTLIHLKPLWNLGKKNFENLWQKMISNRGRFWSAKTVEKEHIDKEKSISLIVKESPSALEIANSVINFLRTNLGQDAALYVPIQIIIDKGAFIRAGKLFIEDINVNWKELEPGEVYASKNVFNALDNNINTSLDESSIVSGDFYKISGDGEFEKEEKFFRYQNALIQGEYPPCFYCGNRSHQTTACPSKMITNLTSFTEKLGYMTIDSINKLFFHYLQEFQSISDSSGVMMENNPAFYAHNAFHELKSVFQLRLFMAIWNNREDNWNKIKDNSEERDRGGLLWIGLDCIRVGNLEQAESIIEKEITQKNMDYRVFCLAALLYIEKNNYGKAIVTLKKALDLAVKNPQKIYILFLLFRAYYLSNDPSKAKEMLRKIITLNPYCTEAIYQDIVLKINVSDKHSALDQLLKLVKKNKDYYVIALIDPDLNVVNEKISSRFDHLFIETRESAQKIMLAAKEEFKSIENLLGKGAEEIDDAKTKIVKMEELSKTESYFGYLDIIHYAESILNLGNKIVQGRGMRLHKMEQGIKQRIQRCYKYFEMLPYGFMTQAAAAELKKIQVRTDGIGQKVKQHGIHDFQKMVNTLKHLSNEISVLESKIKRIDTFTQIFSFCINFFKKNLVFQSANLVISLILLPIMIHYLNFIMPDLNLSSKGIWHFQKMLIILGGISGVILASLTSQNKTTKQ